MFAQRLMWIAWPAFMVAGLLEILIFSLVDPKDLHWLGQAVPMSSTAVYSLAFFVLWVLVMLSSAMTTLLAISPFEVNRCPVPMSERPKDCSTDCAVRDSKA